MSRLQEYLEKIISEKEKILIPYITLGDPDLNTSLKIADAIAKAGANVLEIGIPFSDPLADGPTIQKAVNRALKNKVDLKSGFEFLKKFSSIPVVFMSYLNPILAYGVDRFFNQARKLGLAGVVIPDLPLEEAREISRLGKKNNVAVPLFISPTTSWQRAKKINQLADGFIYYISVTGVTGARKKFPPQLIQNLKQVRKIVTKPLCLGFGISSPLQIKEIKKYVDGIIVGSAVVERIGRNLKDKLEMKKEIYKFISSLRKALNEKNTGS
jgi:tryptophan synthase alpha chain